MSVPVITGISGAPQPEATGTPFRIEVLETGPGRALVAVNRVKMEVHSDLALRPGQVLLVRQMPGEKGLVCWQVLGEVIPEAGPELSQTGYLSQFSALTDTLRQAGFSTGFPVLPAGLDSRFIGSLLASLTLFKTGSRSPLIWQAVSAFLDFYLKEADRPADSSRTPGGAELSAALKERVGKLRLLGEKLAAGGETLDGLLSAFFSRSGEEGKRLLGGQVYTCTNQEQSDGFYYLPLGSFSGEALPAGEILIRFPRGGGEEKSPCCWRLILSLETERLGWVQFDLVLEQRELLIGALAERPETRALIEGYREELEQALKSHHLQVNWKGCRLGRVFCQIRALQELADRWRRNRICDYLV